MPRPQEAVKGNHRIRAEAIQSQNIGDKTIVSPNLPSVDPSTLLRKSNNCRKKIGTSNAKRLDTTPGNVKVASPENLTPEEDPSQ